MVRRKLHGYNRIFSVKCTDRTDEIMNAYLLQRQSEKLKATGQLWTKPEIFQDIAMSLGKELEGARQ
jgi:hypothetical protein